jgi:hypothetical protein
MEYQVSCVLLLFATTVEEPKSAFFVIGQQDRCRPTAGQKLQPLTLLVSSHSGYALAILDTLFIRY